ncbi:MAG: cell division protein FtsA [Geminicoccaceae bacterium]
MACQRPLQRLRGAGPWAVLDVGSSKLCCAIARRRGTGLQLLGLGYQMAEGFHAGEVVDARAAELSLRAVLHEAEQQAGLVLRETALSIVGGALQSGTVDATLMLEGRAVIADHVESMLAKARTDGVADSYTIIHAVPRSFTIDGGRPLQDPVGMRGHELKAKVHLVAARKLPLNQLIQLLARCYVDVKQVVAAPYAAALSVLTEEEARRGAIVLDMGAASTGVAAVVEGRLAHLGTVGQGGQHVTQDLARSLRIGQDDAERLKTTKGCVVDRACDELEAIELTLLGDTGHAPGLVELSRGDLSRLLRPRVIQILEQTYASWAQAPAQVRNGSASSLVLTGGACQLEGMVELASEVFQIDARAGQPAACLGLGERQRVPNCAAVAGAIALVAGNDGGSGLNIHTKSSLWRTSFDRVGRWFREGIVAVEA